MESNIYTPTVTIFDDLGKIDIEGNKKVVEYLIEHGVNGLVPLGSTGEFTSIDMESKKELIELYVNTAKERVEIIPGTNGSTIEETIELANYACSLGVKGVLILPPYYYAISQKEAYNFYKKIAESVKGDIYIYNFVARTGFDISADTICKLASNFKNIKGLKDSTTSVSHTKDIIYKVLKVRPDFEVFSGFDDHFIANISAGGKGCIAALSNFEPELWSQWILAVKHNDFKEIVRIQKVIDGLMELYNIESNFSLLFKMLMKENGLDINTTTIFPFNEIENEKLQKAEEIRRNINA